MRTSYEVMLLGEHSDKLATQAYCLLQRPTCETMILASGAYIIDYGNARFITVDQSATPENAFNNPEYVFIIFASELKHFDAIMKTLSKNPDFHKYGLIVVSKNENIIKAANELDAQVIDDKLTSSKAAVFCAVMTAAHKPRRLLSSFVVADGEMYDDEDVNLKPLSPSFFNKPNSINQAKISPALTSTKLAR